MIAIFLSCEQSCGVLVALLVPAICIWVRELAVACLLNVTVMTNCKICTSSKRRSKVNRIKDSTFLVYQTHLLFEWEGKEKRLTANIRVKCICCWSPRNRSESSYDFVKFRLNYHQSIRLAVAKLMKIFYGEIMLTSSVK